MSAPMEPPNSDRDHWQDIAPLPLDEALEYMRRVGGSCRTSDRDYTQAAANSVLAEIDALTARLARADLILRHIAVNGATKPNVAAAKAYTNLAGRTHGNADAPPPTTQLIDGVIHGAAHGQVTVVEQDHRQIVDAGAHPPASAQSQREAPPFVVDAIEEGVPSSPAAPACGGGSDMTSSGAGADPPNGTTPTAHDRPVS